MATLCHCLLASSYHICTLEESDRQMNYQPLKAMVVDRPRQCTRPIYIYTIFIYTIYTYYIQTKRPAQFHHLLRPLSRAALRSIVLLQQRLDERGKTVKGLGPVCRRQGRSQGSVVDDYAQLLLIIPCSLMLVAPWLSQSLCGLSPWREACRACYRETTAQNASSTPRTLAILMPQCELPMWLQYVYFLMPTCSGSGKHFFTLHGACEMPLGILIRRIAAILGPPSLFRVNLFLFMPATLKESRWWTITSKAEQS